MSVHWSVYATPIVRGDDLPGAKGLVGRVGFGPRYDLSWLSRDYVADLQCLCSKCFLNDKAGKCSSPAAASIGEDGRCQLYGKQVAELKKKR